jgi:DNA-binding transcriptional LysR family regulator
MVGQLAGAMALSVSGYLGLQVAGQAGHTLTDYHGIWYLAAAGCAVGILSGWAADRYIRLHQAQ